MSERSFKEIVILAKDDPDVMMYLLERLNPLIRSYTKKMFFLEKEDAQQEIVIAIIEAVKGIVKCENDGQCLSYINNAVKFKFAHLCKQNIKKKENESTDEMDLNQVAYFEKYADAEMECDIQMKKNFMTKKQKDILNYLLLEYSDKEISDRLGISRQYVNRIKKNFI